MRGTLLYVLDQAPASSRTDLMSRLSPLDGSGSCSGSSTGAPRSELDLDPLHSSVLPNVGAQDSIDSAAWPPSRAGYGGAVELERERLRHSPSAGNPPRGRAKPSWSGLRARARACAQRMQCAIDDHHEVVWRLEEEIESARKRARA